MEGYKHILIPLDGSECSERALAQGHLLQKALGSPLTLLYVVSDPDFDCSMGDVTTLSNSIKSECGEAEKYLERMAEQFDGPMKTAVEVGCVAKTIVKYAKEHDCDLIVMGSQGLGSPLRRFFMGSVAKKVLEDAESAVMVVR